MQFEFAICRLVRRREKPTPLPLAQRLNVFRVISGDFPMRSRSLSKRSLMTSGAYFRINLQKSYRRPITSAGFFPMASLPASLREMNGPRCAKRAAAA
jgi:hypothetical protein